MNDALKVFFVLLAIGTLGVIFLVIFPIALGWMIWQHIKTLKAVKPERSFVSTGDTFQDVKKLGALVKEWEMYIPSDATKFTRDRLITGQEKQAYNILRYFHSSGRVVKVVDHHA